MKTQVIMKREIFNQEISQQSKTGFFSATDLVAAGDIWRVNNGLRPFKMSEWLRNKTTKEFIEELEKSQNGKVLISGKGRGSHTWVHPFLFIDMALAISPKLKIQVYSWLYDELLKYRNDSGDSYKKMCGALMLNSQNKSNVKEIIREYAIKIRKTCGLSCNDSWETQTEDTLKLRDKIHENVSLLSDLIKNKDQLIDLAIKKAIEA